jgi:hypothetical protein
MWSMQCNVEFGYQLSICSATKENHGKPWSIWSVEGHSGWKLTSSQKSGNKYASPNTSPYLCYSFSFSFFFLFPESIYKLFLQKCYLYIIWISTKPCITPAEGINTYIYTNSAWKYNLNCCSIFFRKLRYTAEKKPVDVSLPKQTRWQLSASVSANRSLRSVKFTARDTQSG